MKKLALALISTLTLSSVVFAADSISSGYYSTQHPLKGTAASARMIPATDINITNASNSIIYVVVPNSPINDIVYPHNNDHVRHATQYGDTFISLQDPSHTQFWSGMVCRLANVTVYGAPNSYTVNVDSELCQ